MSEIIGSTYEIIGKLGAGGGGVVYLANHLRLEKKVVVKADKRSIRTKNELLRREVDVLKELTHQYIPQVYDYIIENDTAYTVMDYVDGESMDKLLKKQGSFPQADVIKWARQLLSALDYLHSPIHGDPPRGYIHSDIKPANIMLRPNGDICLIDFNIALAIGVENVVGKSEGYSSPEHYGLDYSFRAEGDATVRTDDTVHRDDEKTELNTDVTQVEEDSAPASQSVDSSVSSSFKKIVVPDARSDIYSVGATLYHLLGGKRPARDAKEVVPLSEKDFSPPLVKIITKAMNPNPDLRYGSAREMLDDLNGLWRNDPRVKRQKKRLIAGAVLPALLLAAGGAAVMIGTKQTERIRAGEVLAAQSEQALAAGNVRSAIELAMNALPDSPGLLDIPYTPAAQLALTNALGVYDLSDSFKPYETIELPSAPFRIVKSPDEKRIIAAYAFEIGIFDLETGECIKTLPTLESALCEVEFLNESTILYGGADGLTAYDIEQDKVIWTGAPATAIALSGDGSTAAAICKDEERINFYDTESGEIISFRDMDGHQAIPANDKFADPGGSVLELNADGRMCAVTLENGFFGIIDIYDEQRDQILFDEGEDNRYDAAFAGDILAFSAYNGTDSIFGMVDCANGEYLGDMTGKTPIDIFVRKNELYAAQNDLIVRMDPRTFEQTPAAYTENKNICAFDVCDDFTVSATDTGYSVFYHDSEEILQTEESETPPDFVLITDRYAVLADRNSPMISVLALSGHEEAQVMGYDPLIGHAEARLSSDEKSLMLFSPYGFSIVDTRGNVKVTTELPDGDNVYDQQYRRGDSGDHLEVTYYDGKQVCYSAADGQIISQENVPPPDDSLDEEFETSAYIIHAPLHGTPEVISKESGEKAAELESEDYLTYVTEVGDQLIAQYTSAEDGSNYGILMNGDCTPVAKLPYLSDICNGKLIFDLPGGNIRSSAIYNIDTLKEMAENYGN